MTSRDLEDRIETANQDLFAAWLKKPLPAGRSGLRDIRFPIGSLKARGRGTGEARKAKRAPCQLVRVSRDLITCPARAVARNVAVGHVIADETQGCRDDLSIVIAVGINYYQFRNKHSPGLLSSECRKWLTNPNAPHTWENSGMYQNVRTVCNTLSLRLRNEPERALKNFRDRRFHLVISNIFPWVSRLGWGELGLSSYCEMILLRKFGFLDPIANLLELLMALQPDVKLIIFHGVTSAVPLYADRFASLAPSSCPKTVLVNNLSYPDPCRNLCILV
jgi:hypothetical protein